MTIKIQLLVFLVAGVTLCLLTKEGLLLRMRESDCQREFSKKPKQKKRHSNLESTATAPAEEEEEEEVGTAPLGASEGPHSSKVPTLELMTTDSISPSGDLGGNTTDAEPPTTSEDHLETVTLVGIILGTVAAIGVATGIVIILAKKMSGRYSP